MVGEQAQATLSAAPPPPTRPCSLCDHPVPDLGWCSSSFCLGHLLCRRAQSSSSCRGRGRPRERTLAVRHDAVCHLCMLACSVCVSEDLPVRISGLSIKPQLHTRGWTGVQVCPRAALSSLACVPCPVRAHAHTCTRTHAAGGVDGRERALRPAQGCALFSGQCSEIVLYFQAWCFKSGWRVLIR